MVEKDGNHSRYKSGSPVIWTQNSLPETILFAFFLILAVILKLKFCKNYEICFNLSIVDFVDKSKCFLITIMGNIEHD